MKVGVCSWAQKSGPWLEEERFNQNRLSRQLRLHAEVGAGRGLCGQNKVSLPRVVRVKHACVPLLCSTTTEVLYFCVRTWSKRHIWKESQVSFIFLQACQLKGFFFFFLPLTFRGGGEKQQVFSSREGWCVVIIFFYPRFYSLTSESSLTKTFPFVGWTFKGITRLSPNVRCYFVWMPGIIPKKSSYQGHNINSHEALSGNGCTLFSGTRWNFPFYICPALHIWNSPCVSIGVGESRPWFCSPAKLRVQSM